MCGIAGFVGRGTIEDLKKMTEAVHHRGPDDSGFFFENNVALGHRRLSILDLSPLGHQPMFSSDRKIGLIFVGEIYNFKELKTELEAKGEHFKSTSDTEVIISLYKVYGEKCFEKMNGMFSIGLYDFENEKIMLARDRFGEKPLYWATFNDTLIFGSELKVLLSHPLCKKEIDTESLQLYLAHDYVPTPRTIYKNIFKLEPGTYLTYKNGKVEKKKFWQMKFGEGKLSFNEARNQLDTLLAKSVKERLVADVPVGIFLSGGLDSSTVAYYAKQANRDIHTFSIGFSEKSFDESKYAKQVSEFLGTTHFHKNLSARDSLDLVSEIPEIFDEPVADASVLPTYLLSKFAREHVTVALGGDGGDELFAGYPTFEAHIFAKYYRYIPKFIRNMIAWIVLKLPANETNFSLSFKLKKFVEGIDANSYLMHQKWLGTFDIDAQRKLLRIQIDEHVPSRLLNNTLQNIDAPEGENKLLGSYMKTYMMDDVLVKVDRASMRASLETRAPFLDYHLADFVNSLPYSFKHKGLTGKYLLKKLMDGKLPQTIVYRPKKGFGIPLSAWLKHELKPLCDDLFSREFIDKQGIFNHKYIEQLLRDHLQNKQDNRKPIWNLLVFQMWYKKYMK